LFCIEPYNDTNKIVMRPLPHSHACVWTTPW